MKITNSAMKVMTVVLLATSFGYAQEPSISINDVGLTLGMPKSLALSRLSTRNETKPYPDQSQGDAWCVQPKTEQRLARWECDTVVFQNDKLVSISHEIGDASGDAAAAILSKLYTIVGEAERFRTRVSVVTQDEFERDGWRHRSMSFFIGQKRFDLDVTEPIGSGGGRQSNIRLTEAMYKWDRTAIPKGNPR
jgi:hypothetical protein